MQDNNTKASFKKPIVILGIIIAFGLILYKGTVSNMEVSWEVITEQELAKRLPPKDFVLIDVRQPEEYNTGHIPGAILIPLSQIEEKLMTLDPEKEIVLYCRSGNRSSRAAAFLSAYGFKKIKNLESGINGWKGPLVK